MLLFSSSILLLTEVRSDHLGLVLDLEKREWSLVISVGPIPSDQSKWWVNEEKHYAEI